MSPLKHTSGNSPNYVYEFTFIDSSGNEAFMVSQGYLKTRYMLIFIREINIRILDHFINAKDKSQIGIIGNPKIKVENCKSHFEHKIISFLLSNVLFIQLFLDQRKF